MTTGLLADPAVPDRVPWREIGIFILIAFVPYWLLWLPVVFEWLPSGRGVSGTDATPVALVAAAVGMFIPSVGVFVVTRWVHRPPSIPLATGLAPLRPTRRLIRYCVLALLLFPAVSVATLLVGSVLGLYHADLTGLSGLREALGIGANEPVLAPALVSAAVLFFAGLPMMVGEEWGWRGYLEPRLQPLGLLPMVLLSGFIWGVWHLPAVFVGDREPGLWLTAYIVDCTLNGALLCWLRLRTHTIWPAVLGHAVISGFPGAVLTVWLHDVEAPFDSFAVEALGGWVSWIIKAAILLVIVASGRFRPAEPVPPAPPVAEDRVSGRR